MNAIVRRPRFEVETRAGVTFSPLGPVLGAEVTGVDLRETLAPAVTAALRTGLNRYKVLVFRGQDISHEDHLRFGRSFGDLEGHPIIRSVPGYPEILHITAADGQDLDAAGLARARAANKWHTDVTFREAPSMAGILRARSLPPVGGDTVYADAEAVYRDLPQEVRARIDGLDAEHDILCCFEWVDEAQRERLVREHPPVVHPVVRTHPETGERCLFVNAEFTRRILGVSEAESRELLALLFERVKAPEYHARVRWSPDAVVAWDNRSTQHYAVLDYWPFPRVLERVTVMGDRPRR